MFKHNTHIANNSGGTIKAVLKDPSGNQTSQVIDHGQYKVIPTSHGTLQLDVYRDASKYGPNPEAQYSAESDTSFIVETVGSGTLNISRSVYGNIWKKDENYRSTTSVEGTTGFANATADLIGKVFKKLVSHTAHFTFFLKR